MTSWACVVVMKLPPTKRLQTAIAFAGDNGVPTQRVSVHPGDATGMTPPLGVALIPNSRTPRGQIRFEREG